jgi:hypothetical protein
MMTVYVGIHGGGFDIVIVYNVFRITKQLTELKHATFYKYFILQFYIHIHIFTTHLYIL